MVATVDLSSDNYGSGWKKNYEIYGIITDTG